jgi:hypothetical protein
LLYLGWAFVPQTEKARTVPFGAGYCASDFRQAVVAAAFPAKSAIDHRYPMVLAIPFSLENCAG